MSNWGSTETGSEPTRRASIYKARAVSGAPWCRELRIES
ncbi:hypothetical protein LEMLEM_LOCUS6754 [Lemmus lemmus]